MTEPPDIQFFQQALDPAAAVARVTGPQAGGIVTFLGITRAETDPRQGVLVALDYTAYEEMALAELRKLAEAAAVRWPVRGLVIWHRLGTVAVGQPSVMIAVSCPHRGEAFDCCEFVIDELKKLAPIWKKEIYENNARWQAERESPIG